MTNYLSIETDANGERDRQGCSSPILPAGYALLPEALLPTYQALENPLHCDITVEQQAKTLWPAVKDLREQPEQYATIPVIVSVAQGTVPDPDPIEEAKRIVAECKAELAATDYQAIKYAEGWISEEDYAEIKARRQELRNTINEYENSASESSEVAE